ncbi:histidine phosphatase family protein [Ruegeria sp. 6PALISEP08]|uniref:SixA phosphatase family protein n=1 Tax=Ruegeria sp. 6PALISEP08 TaxID=1225660 RepID=UPI00067F17F3|nr:histidine phosphatase family protein [Ruegeria sp. 6PALISEP08]
MTHTLILTRHAKSSWDNPMLDDHARPLSNRGRKSAPAIAKWLRAHGWVPDEVLSSTSTRTRETWGRMAMTAEYVRFQDALYLAGPDQMIRQLFEAKGRTVLMLGHNPGIAQFARQLVQDTPAHSRFLDYPTCATTVMEFDVASWTEVQWHTGKVLGFAIPRELLE